MPTYLSPGVYVEEVEAGSRPIEGVGTAVAAFVGLAAQGPINEPTLVTNWAQFTQAFGEFTEGTYLAHAVYGYFMNGGGACYVVRVGGEGGNGSAPGRGHQRPACARPARSGRLRRRPRRPYRLRRPRGHRPRHDGVRAGSHGGLPEGHDRPGGPESGAARHDRPLRADGRPGGDP